jgi:hypothetical protein
MCLTPRPHRGRASFANGQNFQEVGLHQCLSERKGEGAPVRSLHVPSHVPSHPQTPAKVPGFSLTASGFTAETDWLLEQAGFELSVPHAMVTVSKPPPVACVTVPIPRKEPLFDREQEFESRSLQQRVSNEPRVARRDSTRVWRPPDASRTGAVRGVVGIEGGVVSGC